jgi:hypothetical protein
MFAQWAGWLWMDEVLKIGVGVFFSLKYLVAFRADELV